MNDLIDWTVGTTAGYTQTSERVAGAGLYQSIGLPGALKARRVGTIYGVIVHVAVVLLLMASTILGLVALGRKIALNAQWRRNRREAKRAGMLLPAKPVVLGFAHGFGGSLLTLTLTTLAAMLIFFAGLGQVIMGVVKLAWGGAPTETPRGDVLELAGDPSGVCAGGLGMVSRVHEAYRSGLASWPYPVAAQARGGS